MEKKKKEIKSMYIYVITNLITNKQYIGSHVCYKEDPYNDGYMGSSKYVKSDIKNLGIQNFKKEIIEFCKDKSILLDLETENIIKYDTLNPNGYNKFLPNKKKGFYILGHVPSEEQRNKLRHPFSEEHRNKLKGPHSAEHRKHLSESLTGLMAGENNPMFGRSLYSCWLEKYGKEIADKKLEDYSKKFIGREPSTKGVKGEFCWIYNPISLDCKMVKTKEIDEYLNNGWVKGNYYNKGIKRSEEFKNNLRSRTGEKSPVFKSKFIYKEGESKHKRVKIENLDKWINEGWIVGIREDIIKKISITNSGEGNAMYGRCFINNGEINKGINKNELDEYLNNGWHLGRLKFINHHHDAYVGEKNGMFGKIFVHDENNKNKVIKKEDLDTHLNQGWIYGKINKPK
jgi:Putative endonuclease segE, GIY-YIG domain/NUMOD3 motif